MAEKPKAVKPAEVNHTLHSAIPSDGLYSISDSEGKRKWITKGKSIDGWTVGDYDEKRQELTLFQGKSVKKVGLGGSTILPYDVPTATPISAVIGGGQLSDKEEELKNMVNNGYNTDNYLSAVDLSAWKRQALNDLEAYKREKTIQKQSPVETATPNTQEYKQ